ncbi:MAG: hypothetical protein HYY31_05590 [Chloroflexi bacterium]|nr:hypothetical protein [Chloroflexota bacterium]
MSWRLRVYEWFRHRPNVGLKWFVSSAVAFFAGAFLVALLDVALGSLELRWGLTVWFSFLTGFSAAACFNIFIELLGIGYYERKTSSP